jgi:hypothetical protein
MSQLLNPVGESAAKAAKAAKVLGSTQLDGSDGAQMALGLGALSRPFQRVRLRLAGCIATEHPKEQGLCCQGTARQCDTSVVSCAIPRPHCATSL